MGGKRRTRGKDAPEAEYIRPRGGKERGRANLDSLSAALCLLPSIYESSLFFDDSSLIRASPSAGLQAHVTQV